MTFQDRRPEIKAGRLLDVIRERPAMYLGERSLTALWHFLHGFLFAEYCHGIEAAHQLPLDFHEWVAYRLHYCASTKGWRSMILEQTGDESAALDRFYQLLDDHRRRVARVVATIQGHKREYRVQQQGSSEVMVRLMPEKLMLVAYTDDPGLFLTSEESGDFPGKDRLFGPWRARIDKVTTTIVDQQTFDRWLEEDERSGNAHSGNAKKLFR